MLKLVVANRAQAPPPAPSAGPPAVQVWRDVDSNVIAWAERGGDEHCVHWPGVATFSFGAASGEATAIPAPGVGRDLVEDTWARSVLPIALHARGHEALHASAVLGPLGVVAFCARSEGGKSTLAYGLSRCGWPQWADDSVVLDIADGTPFVVPLPFKSRLRAASVQFFDEADSRLSSTHISHSTFDIRHAPASGPVAGSGSAVLAAVFVLERQPAALAAPPVHVERLGPSAAFLALLMHAYCFDPCDAVRRAAMVRHYADVAASVPIFRLAFHEGFGRLRGVLDSVNGLVERSEALLRLCAS